MNSAYSKSLIKQLRKAGWSRGRRVGLEPWDHYAYEMYPLAREILSEFGGLVLTRYMPYLARDATRFDFRPIAVHKEAGEFDEIEYQLSRRVFPVALAANMHYEVLVDDSNRLLLRVRGEGVIHAGTNFTVVLETFLVGNGLLPLSFLRQEFSDA